MSQTTWFDIFDLPEGRRRRDEGISRVKANNSAFSIEFAEYILHLPIGWVGKCEDIRRVWRGVSPSHPNAWGACWNGAVKQGLLVELPDHRVPMKAKKSHGRKTSLFMRRHPTND